MAQTERRILRLEIDAGQFKRALKDMGGSLRNIEAQSKRATRNLSSMAKTIRGTLVVAIGMLAARAGRGLFNTVTQFEDLKTSLEAVSGSAKAAADDFALITDITTRTPFQVEALANAFIKLKAAGLDPTTEQLMLFSDVASVATDRLGVLQAMSDLYARTTAGGLGLEDLNRLADRGIPVFDILNEKLGLSRLEISAVGKSAEGAAQILEALAEGLDERFGGASERAAANLSIAASNMGVALKGLSDALFNSTGLSTAFATAINWASQQINKLSEWVRSTLVPALGALRERLGRVGAYLSAALPAALEETRAAWLDMKAVALDAVASIISGLGSLINMALNPVVRRLNDLIRTWAKLQEITGMGDPSRTLGNLIDPFNVGADAAAGLSGRAAEARAEAERARGRAASQMEAYAKALKSAGDNANTAAETIAKVEDVTSELADTIENGAGGRSRDGTGSETQTFLGPLIADLDRLAESGVGRFVDAIGDANTSFKEFARSFLQEIAKMIAEAAILALLYQALGIKGGGSGGGIVSTLLGIRPTPSALGNAFDQGRVIPMAKGGVVRGPTLAPMALMGEADPEAVLPLRRAANGVLGVSGQPVNVQVVNNAGAAIDVTQSEQGVIMIAVNRARQAVQQDFIASMNTGQGAYARGIERGFNTRRRAF